MKRQAVIYDRLLLDTMVDEHGRAISIMSKVQDEVKHNAITRVQCKVSPDFEYVYTNKNGIVDSFGRNHTPQFLREAYFVDEDVDVKCDNVEREQSCQDSKEMQNVLSEKFVLSLVETITRNK